MRVNRSQGAGSLPHPSAGRLGGAVAKIYPLSVVIVGFVVFSLSYIDFISDYGFWIGIGVGLIPSVILAFLLTAFWSIIAFCIADLVLFSIYAPKFSPVDEDPLGANERISGHSLHQPGLRLRRRPMPLPHPDRARITTRHDPHPPVAAPVAPQRPL